MWNEVQEHVREQSARLDRSRESVALHLAYVIRFRCRVKTHSERGHGIQRVSVDLCGYKCKDEVRDTFRTNEVTFVNRQCQRWQARISVRADIERPEHCKRSAHKAFRHGGDSGFMGEECAHQSSIQVRRGTRHQRSASAKETRLLPLQP
jgi:hypothetical protein